MLFIVFLFLYSSLALSPPCFLKSNPILFAELPQSLRTLLSSYQCSLLKCTGLDWSLPLTPHTLSSIRCSLTSHTPLYPLCYYSQDCNAHQFCNLGICQADLTIGSGLINDQCHEDQECATSLICESQTCISPQSLLTPSLKPLIAQLLDKAKHCPIRVQKFRTPYIYDLLSCSDTSTQFKQPAQFQFQAINLPQTTSHFNSESEQASQLTISLPRYLDGNCPTGIFKVDTGNCFTFSNDGSSYTYEGCSDSQNGLVCNVASFSDALSNRQTVPCTRITYTIHNGLSCTANSDCLSQTCGSSGYCTADLDEGQHCVTSHQCKDNLICALQVNSSTRTCSHLKAEGNTCEIAIQNCQSSFYCKQPIALTPNICQATTLNSSSCDSANPCNPYTQYCSDNICELLPGLDQDCRDDNGSLICKEGFFCDSDFNKCKPVYTAAPNLCGSHSQCAIGYYCKQGICTERGNQCQEVNSSPDHRMCRFDKYCGNCVFGFCECLDKINDGSCSENVQCQSGKCQDSKCLIPSDLGQACNLQTTGCYDYGQSQNWARCNQEQSPTCAAKGSTNFACENSSICLDSHYCNSSSYTCQPKINPTRACQGFASDECIQGYICHEGVCTGYLSVDIGQQANSALVCSTGALYNGLCDQVSLASNSVYCEMGSLCSYTTSLGLEMKLECECGGNLATRNPLNGHCPVPPGTEDEARLLSLFLKLNLLTPLHFLQKESNALQYIETTLLSFSPQNDNQRQIFYLAFVLSLRLKLPAQIHNLSILDRFPSYLNSPQIALLPQWALGLTNLNLSLDYVSKFPNCGMHPQIVNTILDFIQFLEYMTASEVSSEIMLIEQIFHKMCQKHGDYTNLLTKVNIIITRYFSQIQTRVKSDQARLYYALLNLADIVSISNPIDKFKIAENLLVTCKSKMSYAGEIDIRGQNLKLFKRFQNTVVNRQNAADIFDKMISTWDTLLDEQDKDTQLLAIQTKIADWMQTKYNSHTCTIIQLSQSFKTVFRATSELAKLKTDFPITRDTHWRNYYLDFVPRSAQIEMVNLEAHINKPDDTGVILVADVTTAQAIPALPVSGCGMQDVGNSDLVSKMRHDRIILFANVETESQDMEFEVLWKNGAVVKNGYTPACCIQYEGQWNVVGEVIEQGGDKYVCKYTRGGLVSMLFYNDNLYDLTLAQFQRQVPRMDEAKLQDFMSFVGHATFEQDELKYKSLIKDSSSCMDCLNPIFSVLQALRAGKGLYYYEGEVIKASKYYFNCLENNFFSKGWKKAKEELELIQIWSPVDLKQTDHYSQKLNVSQDGESDPETQEEAECETVFFFFPSPGFLFEEVHTVHRKVSHVKVPRAIVKEVPNVSRLIFNEFIAHQAQVENFKLHTVVSLGMESTEHTLLHLENLENKFQVTMQLNYDPPSEVQCAQIFMNQEGSYLNWKGIDTLRRQDNRLVCSASETGLFAAVSLVKPETQKAVFTPLVLFILVSLLCGILLACGFKRFFKISSRLKSKHKEHRLKAIKQQFLHLRFKELSCNLLFCSAMRYCLPLVNLFHFYDKQSSLKIQLFLKTLGLLLRLETLLCIVMALAQEDNQIILIPVAMAGSICLFPNSALRDFLSRSKSNFSPIYFQVTPYFLTAVRSQKIHSERGSETNRKLNNLTKEDTPSHCDTPAVTLAYSRFKYASLIGLLLLNIIVLYLGVILGLQAPLKQTLILFTFALISGFLFALLKLAIVTLYVLRRGEVPQRTRNACCAAMSGVFLDSQVFVVANEVILNRPSVIGIDSSPE